MSTELLLALNEDLSLEYAAAIQYIQHAAVIDGVLSAFAKDMLAHADEEIGHAKKLADHINYLGGVPGVHGAAVGTIFTASEASAMLRQDLTGENTAIQRYKDRIKQARAESDYGTEAILLEILADEEHHANDIMTWLGE